MPQPCFRGASLAPATDDSGEGAVGGEGGRGKGEGGGERGEEIVTTNKAVVSRD